MKTIRQGDILFKLCNEKPKAQIKKHAQLTVALGEATGHHHTLYPEGTVKIFKAIKETTCIEKLGDGKAPNIIEEFFNDGKRFIKLDAEWLLRHQEHKELKIGPGTYEIITEREYDPFAKIMKKVVD